MRADDGGPLDQIDSDRELDLGMRRVIEERPAFSDSSRDGYKPRHTRGPAGTPKPKLRPTQGLMIAIAIATVVVAASVAVVHGPEQDASAGTTSTQPPPPGGPRGPVAAGTIASTVPEHRSPGWIAAENALPGTSAWTLPDDKAMWEKIRGFADRTSVDRGRAFAVHVNSPGAPWRIDAYRIGYYGGTGGRLVWQSDAQPPIRQPAATTDKATGMREAPWPATLTVSSDGWPPGVYLLKLVSDDGGSSYIPMVVRDDSSNAAVVVQSSVATWQAYNDWGGASLYVGPHGAGDRSKVVSFDRPYGGNGSGEFFGREYELVNFVERLGLDVTYWTDVDLHERPELAKNHHAIVMLGHDEYYTTAMRTGLEQARDVGVNLAFLGANNAFRKIRLEPSPLGPSRHEVNYRSARDDPLSGKQNGEVTVSWREAPSNNPEASLTGSYYECNPVKADLIVGDDSAWVFEGVGVKNGDKWPNAVGNEYDRVTPGVGTPPNIQILAHSPVTCRGRRSNADMTYYSSKSGAGVFDAATFWLIPPLDDNCAPDAVGTPPASCQIQRMVENLLRAFAVGPAGVAHPSVPNTARFGISLEGQAPKPPTSGGDDDD